MFPSPKFTQPRNPLSKAESRPLPPGPSFPKATPSVPRTDRKSLSQQPAKVKTMRDARDQSRLVPQASHRAETSLLQQPSATPPRDVGGTRRPRNPELKSTRGCRLRSRSLAATANPICICLNHPPTINRLGPETCRRQRRRPQLPLSREVRGILHQAGIAQ